MPALRGARGQVVEAGPQVRVPLLLGGELLPPALLGLERFERRRGPGSVLLDLRQLGFRPAELRGELLEDRFCAVDLGLDLGELRRRHGLRLVGGLDLVF
jgi:hypothetical protein